MPKHRLFTIGYGIIMLLVIIWLMSQVQFIFRPIVVTFQTLFIPFLLAGILFYLIRPIVNFMARYKIPRPLGILLVYLLIIGVLVGLIIAVGPVVQDQFNLLIENVPRFADLLIQQWEILQDNQGHFPDFVYDWLETATGYLQTILQSVGMNLGNIIGGIASTVIILVIVPFILFYMLKDGHRFADSVAKFIPEKNRTEAKSILGDMDKAVKTYVVGQMIVSVCVGVMVLIWYLIIGLDYSLILALIAMVTNLIPFVGPFIGAFPAVIVGLIESPTMMLLVILGVVVAQQIESNLISPQVMGRVLEVHPLTIILLLLVAGSLAGFIGLILAVPVYAVIKVVARHTVRLYRLRN